MNAVINTGQTNRIYVGFTRFLERLEQHRCGTEAPRARSRARHTINQRRAFAERLLSIMNAEDDLGLSEINNKRRRYVKILWQIGVYLDEIDRDKFSEIGRLATYIGSLGVALEDLIRGSTDQLFVVTEGSRRDSMRTWGARLQAVLGLECLILSGLSRQEAASHAARHYETLASLKRGVDRDLKGSLLSWYDGYIEERVPVSELQARFQTRRCELKAANHSPAEYRRVGEQCFARAVQSVAR